MSETRASGALQILHDWVQSESLRKHCYAVADSMKHFARLRGEDADLWEAVGLLHDMDYERHPNLERNPTEGHPFVGVEWLRGRDWGDEVCRAILSHADYSGVSRETPLEKTLYAVDELSSFVVAVALVRPTKALENEMAVSPRDAFLGEAEIVPVDDAVGRISRESIAGYPPGIPALLPGELITTEVIAYLRELRDAGARLHGASDPSFATVTVLANE